MNSASATFIAGAARRVLRDWGYVVPGADWEVLNLLVTVTTAARDCSGTPPGERSLMEHEADHIFGTRRKP